MPTPSSEAILEIAPREKGRSQTIWFRYAFGLAWGATREAQGAIGWCQWSNQWSWEEDEGLEHFDLHKQRNQSHARHDQQP